MKNSVGLFIVFCIHAHLLFGQYEIIERVDIERVIENILPQQEVDLDYNDLYDRLFSLYVNPLDLNAADRTEFQSLFFLSEEQISGIIEYRKEFGDFLTLFELLSVDGFDKETIERLSAFVTIDQLQVQSLKHSLKHPAIHDLFLRYQTTFEQMKGYTPPDTTSSGDLTSRYAGNPDRLYARYLLSNPGYYSFGFTIEKDPGESILWDPETSRYGMDYYSFHAMLENRGVFKKIILGDFSMDFGQGLVLISGLSFGKGIETITTIRRNNLGLKPYRSVFEDRDFSGLAVSTLLHPVELNMFFSHVKRDAIIREDTIDQIDQFFSSIQTIGLHRTPSEIQAKNKLKDQSFGMNINYKNSREKLEVGLNAIYTQYSYPSEPSNRNYNQFDFRGLSNYVGSLYANYYLPRAHLFTELAIAKSHGKAMSSGIIASLSSQVQASLHLRMQKKTSIRSMVLLLEKIPNWVMKMEFTGGSRFCQLLD